MRTCLPCSEVIKAIERKRPERVPMILHHYSPVTSHKGNEDSWRQLLTEYPMDIQLWIQHMPSPFKEKWSAKGYYWVDKAKPENEVKGLDAEFSLTDWSQLKDVLANWPTLAIAPEPVADQDQHNGDDRYKLLHWWNCLFETSWKLRGMENLLTDVYLNPGELHQLLDAVTDFSCQIIERAGRQNKFNGVWVTDDMGTQKGPMFGLNTFREFFKPRYKRLIDTAHRYNMHFWLHSCGNIELFLDDFVEIGLDVIHPIQKYTMNERKIAERIGGKICIWAGMDVQQILPSGSEADIRREVRFMLDTYDRAEGGCMLALGNMASADVPLNNLRIFYDECYTYGRASRRPF